MLIRAAEVAGRSPVDVRVRDGRVAEIGALVPAAGEPVLDAGGGLLLPGLHDHHIHLAAFAAARASVRCGPPEVHDADELAAALAGPGSGWLRGIGYHESVAGLPDASALDALAPHRPLRIQHRSGRMWLLNSLALDTLLAREAPPPGLERVDGRWTGRLFDEDAWLRRALGGTWPDFAAVSGELAGFGVTGVTDMSPANDPATAAHFAQRQRAGRLVQRAILAGTPALAQASWGPGLGLGPVKLHLHEAALPPLDEAIRTVATAHADGRGIAVHCTSEVELVFALAAIESAGPRSGDRIEHAGVASDGLVGEIARLGLQVVTQPHFITERGDQYLRAVEPRDIPHLYRLAEFERAGVPLAGGSDAPFGTADPWAAMRAAVSRRTAGGAVIGAGEALSPERALRLYLADPLDLPRQRTIGPGAPADLCLLDRPWSQARRRLRADDVRATLIGGSVVRQRVDQPPL
ncbi:MAG: amidohydrolase family protein [Novosphingobium sp.]